MKTEKEARNLWCPFAKTIVVTNDDKRESLSGTDFNRAALVDVDPQEPILPQSCLCVASQCMAFRWAPDAERMLGNGMAAIVDAEDADLLEGVWWGGRYPKTAMGYLHRAIVERVFGSIPLGMMVDHIDGDGLNNRRGNLRVVTPTQNAANSASRGGKSKYRGVHQQKSGRWAAQIASSGIRMCLGTWDTEKEAAAAYDKAAKEVHGEFARLNLTPITNSGRKGFCGLAGKP